LNNSLPEKIPVHFSIVYDLLTVIKDLSIVILPIFHLFSGQPHFLLAAGRISYSWSLDQLGL